MQETPVQSLVRKIPWRREWQPTPVFLPGESHGWRSLVGYSLWVKKSWTHTHFLDTISFDSLKSLLKQTISIKSILQIEKLRHKKINCIV